MQVLIWASWVVLVQTQERPDWEEQSEVSHEERQSLYEQEGSQARAMSGKRRMRRFMVLL